MPTLLSDKKGIPSPLRAIKNLSKESFAVTRKQALISFKSRATFDLLFTGFGLFVSLLITHAYITDRNRAHLLLVALAIILAALRPVFALCALIFILPLFGHRPTTEQFHLLLMTSAAINTTLAIKLLWLDRKNRRGDLQSSVFGHPLMLIILLYFLASLASLTSLPWKQVLLEYQSAGGINPSLLQEQVRTFLNVNETSYAYSILTVLLTQQAILIAFFVHVYVQRASRNATIFCASFAAGLALTLVAGVLDFYHLINLEFLRPLDPNINPGGIQVRLQSLMGHSGWLAEYIALTIPYALILFLKGRSRIRVSLLVLILMLGTLVTILTYQRGGWITYAVTLLLVCLSFYWLQASEGGAASWASLKRSSLKALVLLALILVVPIATIYPMGKTNRGGQSSGLSGEQYAERVVEIKNVWERMVFFRAGYRLGLLHPFLGGGSEGFDFLYRREFLDPQGKYFNDPIPLGTLYSTAHNVYMQTFSGKGLWGLFFLILPVIYLIASGLRLLKEPDINRQQRLIILISVCGSFAFLVYGNMQEFFYIQSLQYIFFITLAIFSASLGERLSLPSGYAKFLWIFLAAGLAAHLCWEYGFPGQARRMWLGRPEYGCYEAEEDKVVGQFNWCGQSFRQKFPVSNPDNEPTALLSIGITNPKPDPSPVNLRVELAAHEIGRYQLQPNARYFLPVVIPTALRSLVEDKTVTLKIISDNLFNPAYDVKGSRDYRFLSIMKFAASSSAAVQDFRPCAPLEVWENGKGHWCTQNNLLAVPLKDAGQAHVKFSIRVAHADAADEPVTVTLGQLENAYRQYTLSNQEWIAVDLPLNPELLGRDDAGRPFLKLYVNASRLWNPKKAGAGSDDRDLGVAILLPD
jgi:O-Antigen ligase